MKAILKPKKGIKIRRPDTRTLLSESGEKVTLDSFWRRRIEDGDVIKVEEIESQNKEPKTGSEKDTPKKHKGGK